MSLSYGMLTVAYIMAGVLFILSLGGLSNQETARRGNVFGIVGMVIAVVFTILEPSVSDYRLLIAAAAIGGVIGAYVASRIAMTAMPQLVAMLHSFVGLAAVLVGIGSYLQGTAQLEGAERIIHEIEIYVGVFIGGVTFTGSLIAFAKLQELVGGKPLLLPQRHFLNIVAMVGVAFLAQRFFAAEGMVEEGLYPLLIMTGISFILGIHLVMSIGGADMPVVVSMLNSYSGWTAAATGFLLSNDLLIITGALVGSSGAILSYIMCKAMNRSLVSVIFGGFGATPKSKGGGTSETSGASGEIPKAISITHDEAANLLKESKNVVIIPGYGMAVARAQHSVREITSILREHQINVRFAIHPVAGRLPGHMNVLLAEANIPYDIVLEMDEINGDFPETDVVMIIGANDIVNPAALEDPSSPIWGMPVLECWKAKNTIVLKRSMAAGYAGIDNPLFYKDNTRMLFGDAKNSVDQLLGKLRQ